MMLLLEKTLRRCWHAWVEKDNHIVEVFFSKFFLLYLPLARPRESKKRFFLDILRTKLILLCFFAQQLTLLMIMGPFFPMKRERMPPRRPNFECAVWLPWGHHLVISRLWQNKTVLGCLRGTSIWYENKVGSAKVYLSSSSNCNVSRKLLRWEISSWRQLCGPKWGDKSPEGESSFSKDPTNLHSATKRFQVYAFKVSLKRCFSASSEYFRGARSLLLVVKRPEITMP